MTPEQITRFWSHVEKSPEPNGCWIWTAHVDRRGYGRVRIEDKLLRAHRVSYELAYGPIAPGLFACHRCDIRACVRPDHLFAGTNSDNMRDCVAKGRFVVGQRGGTRRMELRTHCNHGHALTPENLIVIQRPGGVTRPSCGACRVRTRAISVVRKREKRARAAEARSRSRLQHARQRLESQPNGETLITGEATING